MKIWKQFDLNKSDTVFEYAFVFRYKDFQYEFIMAFDFDNQKLELRKFYSMELE